VLRRLAGARKARNVDPVLHRDGKPVQGSRAAAGHERLIEAAGVGQRPLVLESCDRVRPRVELMQRGQVRRYHFGGGHLARPQGRKQFARRPPADVHHGAAPGHGQLTPRMAKRSRKSVIV
jgi:hypothetical protein